MALAFINKLFKVYYCVNAILPYIFPYCTILPTFPWLLTFYLCLFLCCQVISIEKAESTSLLPNPVIVSVRSKKAFQLIELQDRDSLVDSLTSRLRALQWKYSMFRSKKSLVCYSNTTNC